MKAIYLFLSLLFLSQFVQAEEFDLDVDMIAKAIEEQEENSSLIDLEGMPNAIVGGTVNAITGHYFEGDTDLIMSGPNSIPIQRFYNSGNWGMGTLCHGWDLNLHGKISTYGTGKTQKAIVYDRGGQFVFEGPERVSHTTFLKFQNKMLRNGVTNCSTGLLSGRSNLMNKTIEYKNRSKICTMKTESGEILTYQGKPNEEIATTHFYLQSVRLSNGCGMEYSYDRDKRPDVIKALGKTGQLLHQIQLIYPQKFKKMPKLEITSQDGRRLLYQFQKMKSQNRKGHRYFLKEVVRDHGPNITYDYKYVSKHTPERLFRKSFPENRFLQISYYEKGKNNIGGTLVKVKSKRDSRAGRVAELHAPSGSDQSPRLSYRFFYNLDKDKQSQKPIGGNTEVYDAHHNKTVYYFSDEHRLTAVEHFLKNGELYRKERILWGENGSQDYTFLKVRGLEDGTGTLRFGRSYRYDNRGNALEERMVGNLSGWNTASPFINRNGILEANGSEEFVKFYTYTEDNLLATEKDGTKTIAYEYYPQTDQIRLKLVMDEQQIRERQFMVYDDNGAMILEITDDGSTSDINNLSGVTERLIKKVQSTATCPVGLPGVIEELYLDIPTGREILLKRTVNSYSVEGYPTRQDIYDSHGDFSYSKEWVYDAMGNVLEETEPLGQKTTYKYDKNGNCIFKQTPNLAYYTTYLYDFSNRLTREEEVYTNGRRLAKTFQYDLKGNCICSTDIYGNPTRYLYDAFDRMFEKILPPIPDGNSNDYQHQPSEAIEYDIFNNPVSKTDCNGNTTQLAYNARGKPCWMQHPDGSIEKSEFNLDGTIRKTTDPEGVATLYIYDYNQQKTREEKYSPSGELLSVKTWTYGAYHLLSETDAKGNSTTYEYDGAGRPAVVRKGAMETRYVYDSLGRKHETWELYEEGQYRRTIEEHDALDRVIEERIEDVLGNILSRKKFAYDVDGNRTHVSISSSSGESCTVTAYNSHKEPIRVTTPDGQITTVVCHYDYWDGWGEPVAAEEEIDPRGNVTLRVKDTHGRVAFEERKNAIGELASRASYRYDGMGNLVRRYDDIIVAGEKKKTVCVVFGYDSRNNQTTIIEAYGEPEQKTTRKEYTSREHVSRIIKPDGVILDHRYDALGRLVEMRSSDSTIHYIYAYDLNDNVVAVEDHVHHVTTYRTFDENDHTISETLDYGAHLQYGYDRMGRLAEFILPDSTKVSYAYDAKYLRSITRESDSQDYIHHYRYDLSGKISRMVLPHQVGEVNFTYDGALRPTSVASDYFSQQIPQGGYDPCGNVLTITQQDVGGEAQVNYSYDALHQLITEEGMTLHSYRFDSLCNRVCKDETSYENNSLHQLVSEDQNQYHYDPNGNLLLKESANQHRQYQYDALDRLVAVTTDTRKTVYHYDAFHRRMSKTSYTWEGNDWRETSVQKYLYQKEKEVGVVADDGTIAELRILGLGYKGDVGAAVALEFGESTYVPLHDYRGNVVGVVDVRTKEVVEAYRYTAYGEETVLDKEGKQKEGMINPWRFSSKRVDPETGWNYFGRRYYDPVVGRWTTPDPMWFEDGPNLYCYVQNRPMMFIDPDGLFFRALFGLLGEAFLNSSDGAAFSYDRCANTITPPGHLLLLGHKNSCSRQIDVPGKQYKNVAFTFINGMWNSPKKATESAEIISRMGGGCHVTAVYNATHCELDLVECGLGLAHIETDPVQILRDTWDQIFKNGGDNQMIVHTCHSQGAIHTMNALRGYDEELRKRITVLAIAPAAYVDKNTCKQVKHFVSRGDVVHRLDSKGRARNSDTVFELDRHPDASWFDHSFDSPTFTSSLETSIEGIMKKHGVYQ